MFSFQHSTEGNRWLAVVGELGSDGAKWHWFLLLMFLCFLFSIWLSQVLAALPVSDLILFLL